MKKEGVFKFLFAAAALFSVLAVVVISLFLFASAFPTIKEIGPINFLFGKIWKPSNDIYGIFPMIVGSVYVTGISILIGVPLGLFTALYMTYFAPKKLYRVMKPAVELLAGIPSIVYGFFGLMVLVPLFRSIFGSGKSILTASVLLSFMILPTIITVSESSLRALDNSLLEGALALGDTKEKAVFRVMVPAASSGILSSVILGVGRSIGETMAVVMVAGNQPRIPGGVLDGVRTMTANIVLEMGYATDLHREALIATGAVLFVFVLILNLSFSLIRRKK
ncbi:MAG: phosphate ABC transporter permease subunit PstC [Spirochaetales bacterium]|nr:phosphate ABC transporter permease subunit PstC [Spirochaetales bacterium]MDD6840928.1 phosphate ABC transporter permease subunit PstC [Spirochaetales bacterium]